MHRKRTAFIGGKVWTAGYSAPRELDVLIEDGCIAHVSRGGELAVDGAEIVDATGRLLMPGFQDAHAHPAQAGANLLGCDLTDATTAQQALATIAAHTAAHPHLEWIVGGGWARSLFPRTGPTREQLDSVTAGKPAFLRSYDCHGAWVNSTALALAGIDASTPDPPNGFFHRDANGAPTGMLGETALTVVREAMPPDTTTSQKRALLRANQRMLSVGITSMQDALVGGGLGMPDQIPAYKELLTGSEWRCRLTTALWWDPTRGTEQVRDLQEKRRELEACASQEWIIADTVKLMIDGTNTLFLDRDAVHDATIALDAAGFTCHYHSYGEASTTWILDAIAAARHRNGPSGGRHHIAHLMVVDARDFARFAELDVTANVQAAWGASPVHHDIMGLTTCSSDPHTREYAFGRLAAAGARLAAGSDWPVTTPDPLRAVYPEVTRGRDRKPTGAEGEPDELDRLDLTALFTAYTAGSAHVNGRPRTGRVATGHLADLVLLDRDPFEGSEALDVAQVDQTWLDGTCVYERRSA